MDYRRFVVQVVVGVAAAVLRTKPFGISSLRSIALAESRAVVQVASLMFGQDGRACDRKYAEITCLVPLGLI
jgi:hypothetical protein